VPEPSFISRPLCVRSAAFRRSFFSAEKKDRLKAALRARGALLLTALAFACALGAPHVRGEPIWEKSLTEYIGHHWTGELLHYRVETERPIPKECHLVASEASGESRPVPCQISNPSTDKEKGVHSCDLHCLLDLEPYQALKLELLPGKAPGELGEPLPVQITDCALQITDSGLQIAEDAAKATNADPKSGIRHPQSGIRNLKSLLVSSLTLEMQVPATIEDASGLPEDQIPPPLLRMRNTEHKCWTGAGRFTNVGTLKSLATKVLARGPAFVDVGLDYAFEDGHYSVVLRVIRDQPVVLWREKYEHKNGSAALMWECSHGMPLRSGVWDYGEWSAFKNRYRAGGLAVSKAFPLEFDAPPARITFQPWIHWANPDLTTWLELWSVIPEMGNVDYKGTKLGEGPNLKEADGGEDTDEFLAGGDDMEAVEAKEKPKAKEWAIGIFTGNPLDWNPSDGGAYRASQPHLELTKSKQVFLRLPIRRGQRTFGLSVAERTPNERVGSNMAVGVPDTAARQIKYGETPLDEVKDYLLDYDDDQPDSYPKLLITEDARANYAASLSEEMPFYGLIQKCLEGCQAQARKECKKLAAESVNWSLADTPAVRSYGDEGVVRAALAATDDSLTPLLQVTALAASRRFAIHFFRHGTGPGMGIAPHNWLSAEYGFGAVDVASRYLTPEQFRRVRARMLFTGYKFSSPNFWSPALGFAGLPNMTTLVNGALGTIAMLYPSHPDAKEWRAAVEREIQHELTHWMGPNGGWLEAPHYMTVSMEPIIGLGFAAANAGNSEILYSDRLKKTMHWLAKISTPRDPRFFNRRHFPEIGNTYVMETSMLFTFMARIYRERDPTYADGMQWLWHEMGCPTWIGIGGANPLTAGYRESLADTAPKPENPPDWRSELFPGSGAVMRAHFPHDRESYLYLIQGPMHSHYDRDQGSFMMWGKGRPLCLDWGYNGCMPASLHNRMDLGGGGKITEFVNLDSADYLHNLQGPWRRQILFVKDRDPLGPNYFLIRDSTSGKGHASWRLWVNAEDYPGVEGQLVSAKGRDDVDLDLWFDGESAKLLKRIPKPTGAEKTPTEVDEGATVPEPEGEAEEEDPFKEALKQEDLQKRPIVVDAKEVTVHCAAKGDGGRYWGNENGTAQRGIHLHVPRGQPVVALLYPRLNEEEQPKISSFCENRALKIETPSGVDYIFLALEPFEATVDKVRFKGKAGAVQVRETGVTLSLVAPGEITAGKTSLRADEPASRTVAGDKLSD